MVVGDIFHWLTVIEVGLKVRDSRNHNRNAVGVVCRCGVTKVLDTYKVKSGHTRSCGCYQRQVVTKAKTKHGQSNSRKKAKASKAYRSWQNMWTRCTNKKNKEWKNYGGRGISVCDRWKVFEAFFADMGEAPENKSLDRVNNEGNYEPENCKWSTPKEQARNRRLSIFR